jgi:hypothetical protein
MVFYKKMCTFIIFPAARTAAEGNSKHQNIAPNGQSTRRCPSPNKQTRKRLQGEGNVVERRAAAARNPAHLGSLARARTAC